MISRSRLIEFRRNSHLLVPLNMLLCFHAICLYNITGNFFNVILVSPFHSPLFSKNYSLNGTWKLVLFIWSRWKRRHQILRMHKIPVHAEVRLIRAYGRISSHCSRELVSHGYVHTLLSSLWLFHFKRGFLGSSGSDRMVKIGPNVFGIKTFLHLKHLISVVLNKQLM